MLSEIYCIFADLILVESVRRTLSLTELEHDADPQAGNHATTRCPAAAACSRLLHTTTQISRRV